jgi:hypothetical protein
MTLSQLKLVLEQAKVAGIEWIYFEGGEPSLNYATMLTGVMVPFEDLLKETCLNRRI